FSPYNAPYLPRTFEGRIVQETVPIQQRVLTKYPDVLKWKWRYTNDLYYHPTGPNAGLYSAGPRSDISKKMIFEYSSKGLIDTKSFPPDLTEDDIVEVYWDLDKKKFTYLKLRNDRPYANSFEVARDNRKHMLTPLTLDTLLGQDMVIYRRWHNNIKNWCLQQIGSLATGWDWGSGVGGDLPKWRRVGFSKV